MNTLPLWVDLLAAGLYVLGFTGTWMAVQDLKRLIEVSPDGSTKYAASRTLGEIMVQRVIVLLAAAVFIGLYFFKIPFSLTVGALVGVYWLYMMWQGGAARAFLDEAGRDAMFNAPAGTGALETSTAGSPKAWHALLVDKAKTSPPLRQKLAQVMWLDAFLMSAIRAEPSREFPEMQQAWRLCTEIACELGIPEQEGADWISHFATPIGRELRILPSRPIAG